MRKKKAKTLDKGTNVKVIVYDDENMALYDMILENFDCDRPVLECSTFVEDIRRYVPGRVTYSFIGDIDTTNNIELDPNTMRRIAKYNKEKELQKIQKQIENAKSKLEEVTKELNKQNDRLNSVKDYVANFIKSNENDFGEFVYDEYHSYDDYDWY